jgi:DNA polymerase III epsilon subunit-like protein
VSKQSWTKAEINFVLKEYKKGFGRKEITKIFNRKFIDSPRTIDSIKHCIDVHGTNIEKDLPRVLILDIETAPLIGYMWGLFDQNIPLNMVIKDWFILSFSAKWLGESDIIYKDQRNKKGKALENDKPLLMKLRKMLDEADSVITHNGISFDIKKINAKFIQHGIEAPSPYKNIDTLRMSRKLFGFTSNKLEYLTKKFCTKHKKLDHSKFSGFKLWDECLKGNIKAWKSMEAYNKTDVLSLEELFVKMSVYDKTEAITSAMRTYRAVKNGKING